MQLELLSYADVNFINYECQGINYDDKGFLVCKPVTSRPNKYIGLDLT